MDHKCLRLADFKDLPFQSQSLPDPTWTHLDHAPVYKRGSPMVP